MDREQAIDLIKSSLREGAELRTVVARDCSTAIFEAVKAARKGYLKTVGLSGNDGGLLAKEADLVITVASTTTARIQECHIAVGHLLCELTEEALARGKIEKRGSDVA